MKKKDDLNFFPINWYFIGAVNVPALNRICFWPLGTKLIIFKYVYQKCSSVAQLHKLQGICCSQASALLIVFWSNAASNSNFNYGDFLLLICLWGAPKNTVPLTSVPKRAQCLNPKKDYLKQDFPFTFRSYEVRRSFISSRMNSIKAKMKGWPARQMSTIPSESFFRGSNKASRQAMVQLP